MPVKHMNLECGIRLSKYHATSVKDAFVYDSSGWAIGKGSFPPGHRGRMGFTCGVTPVVWCMFTAKHIPAGVGKIKVGKALV